MKKLILLFLFVPALLWSQQRADKLSEYNKSIVIKTFEVVGNGDFANMDKYIAKDYVRHSQATPDVKVRSLGDFKEFIRRDRMAFPDQKIDLVKVVAQGDLVAFWATYRGTQTGQMGSFPPSNKSVEVDFAGMHRLEDGKIVESWLTWDNITVLTQLGHFPPPSQLSTK